MTSWTPPVVQPGRPLREHHSEAQWAQAGREILARHDLPISPLAMFSSGSDVVLGGEHHVVKLSTPRCREQMDNERAWNEHLCGRLSVRVAEVVAHGEHAGWPHLITQRLAGPSVAEVWPTLDAAERRTLAADLGAMMAELHAQPLLAGAAERWPDFMELRRTNMEARHRSVGAPDDLLDEALIWVDTTPRPERSPVCLHTELLGHHILLRRTDRWRPSALIDLADAEVGHPDYDVPALVEFIFRGEPGCLGACLAAYGWPEAERGPEGSRRLMAWSLLHRFASLPRMIEAAGDPVPDRLDVLCERLFRM